MFIRHFVISSFEIVSLKSCSWAFCASNHHLRWMIELPPSRTAPTIRNVTNLAVTSHFVNNSEIVDHIYDIIEKLQKICFNMNLFFGKKVGEARIEIGKLFFSKKIIRRWFLRSWRRLFASPCSSSTSSTTFVSAFISGHRVKDTWSALIKRMQDVKRKISSDEKVKAQVDELVSIMVHTRVEMKAAGLFNIDLTVITSVSVCNAFV